MRFKDYSRFVPNVTGHDVQAFAGLLLSRLAPKTQRSVTPPNATSAESALAILQSLLPKRLAELTPARPAHPLAKE
jgi:hypothetical protein